MFVLFYFILLILKPSTAHSHTDREEDPALEDDIYIQHAETRRDEISCGKRDVQQIVVHVNATMGNKDYAKGDQADEQC